MIKVKLTTYNYNQSIRESIQKQTPRQSLKWGEVQFYLNEDVYGCDYWVIFDYLPKEETTHCQKENTIFIAGEPSSIKKYDKKFLNQFSKIITCQRRIQGPNVFYMAPGHTWRPEKNYDELSGNYKVEKNKLISIVVSNKSGTPGHKKRLEFCMKLKEHFGDKIDIFGRGINDFGDKWDVLAPYKYSIAIENSAEVDNMTEKIGDCYTTLTFPFYYGCPNIDRYYDKDSYQLIDIDDFDGTCTKIENIINDEQHYERHLKALIKSKNKYINEYSLIPLIANFIQNNNRKTYHSKIDKIRIRPQREFQEKSYFTTAIRTMLRKIRDKYFKK